jgi:hypothetical protein
MILAVSTALLAVGLALLLASAVRIAFGLLKIVAYFVVLVLLLLCLVVQGAVMLVAILLRWSRGMPAREPEPVISLTFTEDNGEDDGPAIELPRTSFRRLRG